MNRTSARRGRSGLLLVLGLGISWSAVADFLETPSISETPELRTKSLLRDIDIPEVKFRSPDPTQGPRLAVREFRVQGLVEYPELGITREAVAQLVEKIRFDLMKEGQLLESGYTLDELGEVSDLLGEIEEEAVGRHVEPVDVQRLVWLIREQRGRRGITLGQIEGVANIITQFYRERGFVLAKAYIPKQQVRDGIVNLTLLLGTLGEVKVSGNRVYSEAQIASVFDDMMGKPITNTLVEERLYLVNDYPGLFVEGYFEPGRQVGDTRLGVNLRKESRYSANARLDSHGTEDTGRYRAYVDGQVNNLFGIADRLKLGLLAAFQPSNTDYWSLEYQAKPFGPRLALGVDLSENQFLVDQSEVLTSQFKLTGDVFVRGVNAAYLLRRTRHQNSTIALRYEEIESDLEVGDFAGDQLDDRLKNISLSYEFDRLQEQTRRFHQGRVRLLSGKFVSGADEGQKESYPIVNIDYSLLSFWRLPLFDADTRLIYRAELQYAGINLSGVLRSSLAGPTRARAYEPGLFTGDDVVFLGVDWIFNAPQSLDFNIINSINLRELVKPVVFVDFAYGRQNPLEGNSDTVEATLIDVGFGFKFAHGKSFNGNLHFAFPVKEEFKSLEDPPEVESSRVVFDFQYSF